MALQGNITLNCGLPLEHAYIRFSSPTIIKRGDAGYILMGSLSYHIDADHPPVETPAVVQTDFDLSGANPFDQGYAWLKANRFPEATDV